MNGGNNTYLIGLLEKLNVTINKKFLAQVGNMRGVKLMEVSINYMHQYSDFDLQCNICTDLKQPLSDEY